MAARQVVAVVVECVPRWVRLPPAVLALPRAPEEATGELAGGG